MCVSVRVEDLRGARNCRTGYLVSQGLAGIAWSTQRHHRAGRQCFVAFFSGIGVHIRTRNVSCSGKQQRCRARRSVKFPIPDVMCVVGRPSNRVCACAPQERQAEGRISVRISPPGAVGLILFATLEGPRRPVRTWVLLSAAARFGQAPCFAKPRRGVDEHARHERLRLGD